MPRRLLPLMCSGAIACGSPSLELVEDRVDQAGGGALHLEGDFAGHGAVLVSIDGVPARAVVIEGPRSIEVEVPPLPRPGRVDVELRFADGHRIGLESALEVRAPTLGPSEGP